MNTTNSSAENSPARSRSREVITLVLTSLLMAWIGYVGAHRQLAPEPPAWQVPRSGGWAKVQKQHLTNNPFCAACGTKDNLEVHHVKPFHLHPELELDPANLITLCRKPGHNCHFVFGHLWDYKKSNPNVREDVERISRQRSGP